MKKQNGNGIEDSNPPSTSMNDSITRLNNILNIHLTDNLSQLEIVNASRSAAEVASKIAIAARATAEKKAAMAAMAMAAAKKALELVAAVNEQDTSSSTLKKNKRKKHVDVQMLYDNNNPIVENGNKSDEELARHLHHVINSSPRIPKKIRIPIENGGISNENVEESDEVACDVNVDGNLVEFSKFEEGKGIIGRKKGRMKQKKLPLSICHDRGQLNPNEEHLEKNSLWKCQVFKTGARLKENKATES